MSFSATIQRTWRDNRLLSALLELTYACNLDCTFCYNDRSLGGQDLSLEQYRELLEDLASLGALNLSLSGGEPLAHPYFFEIGGLARHLGFSIRLKTNGHAVKEAVARRIREEIDPLVVEVSLHGATAETHDRQTRVEGSFDRLIANIRGMRATGLRVKANSVLTRWNEDEVERLLTLCDELRIQAQIDPEVKPRDDGDRGPLEIEATTDGQARLRQVFEARRERNHAMPETLSAKTKAEASAGANDKHCGAGSNTIAVDPYGRVLPCVQWRIPVGNLHEQRLAEIWRTSAALQAIRETTTSLRQTTRSLGESGRAARFCPGAAHVYSGDPLAIDPPAQKRMGESTRAQVRLPVLWR